MLKLKTVAVIATCACKQE